jgi:hypothetical protein
VDREINYFSLAPPQTQSVLRRAASESTNQSPEAGANPVTADVRQVSYDEPVAQEPSTDMPLPMESPDASVAAPTTSSESPAPAQPRLLRLPSADHAP